MNPKLALKLALGAVVVGGIGYIIYKMLAGTGVESKTSSAQTINAWDTIINDPRINPHEAQWLLEAKYKYEQFLIGEY